MAPSQTQLFAVPSRSIPKYSGCGIKLSCVRIKKTLSRHQPNPDPESVSTTSVQNKQPPAPNASNQNNQQKKRLYKDTVGPYTQANQMRTTHTKTQDHQNTTTRKSPSQTCVSPEKTGKQHKKTTQTGPEPKTPTKSICHGTQWLVHCITLKNV